MRQKVLARYSLSSRQSVMTPVTPHYLLTCSSTQCDGQGHWRFVLRPLDGSPEIEAADVEPDIWGERLDLLTVIRALESLDQPSWVTLVGCTRYVEQGVLYGLSDWKENGWCWECFGKMVPVRDTDLWQRMDRILQFHRLDCGQRRFDAGHAQPDTPHWGDVVDGKHRLNGLTEAVWIKCCKLATNVYCVNWAKKIACLWHWKRDKETGRRVDWEMHKKASCGFAMN